MGSISKSKVRSHHVADVLRAVAHPLRIRIIAILCDDEHHVNHLSKILEVPQAIVSQQLRILRLKGLVHSIRRDGFVYYRLSNPHLRNLVHCMERASENKKRSSK